MDDRALEVLLVEDNPGDARLIAEAFKETAAPHRLIHLPDGAEGLAYLQRQGPFQNAAPPALILLDLNLPRLDGREVLAQIKSSAQLRRIPVIVLTSSQAAEDIHKVYDLAANCYVLKPTDLEHYLKVINIIQDFWFQTVQLPLA